MTPEEKAEAWNSHPSRCFARTNSAMTQEEYGHSAYLAGYKAAQPQWTLLGDERPPDGALCVVRSMPMEQELSIFDYDLAEFSEGGPDWQFRSGHTRSAHDDESWIILREMPKEKAIECAENTLVRGKQRPNPSVVKAKKTKKVVK